MRRLLIAVACIYAFLAICGILVYLCDKLIDWLSRCGKEKKAEESRMIIKWSDKVMTNAGHCPTCGAKLENADDLIELSAGDMHCKNCGCYVGSRKGFGIIKIPGKDKRR